MTREAGEPLAREREGRDSKVMTLAAAFQTKMSVKEESSSFSFAFEVSDDEETGDHCAADSSKKKKKKKKKKKSKKSKNVLVDDENCNTEKCVCDELVVSSQQPQPVSVPEKIKMSPKKEISSPGPRMISSKDPELGEEQRNLRKFGKGLNVSIIGPKKKIVADWKKVPPGFDEIKGEAFSTSQSNDCIISSSSPFTFGFM